MSEPGIRAPIEQSRAYWQQTEGRGVYEEWTELALQDLQVDVDALLSSPEDRGLPMSAHQLSHFLEYCVGSKYGDIASSPPVVPPSAAVLLEHQDGILSYTAASTFGEDEDGVLIHAGDSLTFGLRTSMALAVDTLEQGNGVAEDPARLGDIAEVLEDPSFVECVNELGAAGFGVYRTSFGSFSSEGLLNRMRRTGCEQEFLRGEVTSLIYRSPETGRYVVYEKALNYLAETMREQNANGLVNTNQNAAGNIYGMRPPITVGCLVRRPSAGRLEFNHGQSGIVQAANWLAGTVRQIAEHQERR
jgi:hypothetical protein